MCEHFLITQCSTGAYTAGLNHVMTIIYFISYKKGGNIFCYLVLLFLSHLFKLTVNLTLVHLRAVQFCEEQSIVHTADRVSKTASLKYCYHVVSSSSMKRMIFFSLSGFPGNW